MKGIIIPENNGVPCWHCYSVGTVRYERGKYYDKTNKAVGTLVCTACKNRQTFKATFEAIVAVRAAAEEPKEKRTYDGNDELNPPHPKERLCFGYNSRF